MTKELFLDILKDGLYDFPEGELSDILYDYKEHFDVGFASNKSEDEIISELGEPHDIVAQYRNGYLKKCEPEIKNEDKNEEYTDSNYSKDYSSNTTNNETYNADTKKNQSNTLIVTSIIVVLALILFGPIATALVLSCTGLLFGLFGASLGLLVASGSVLICKFFTSTVGIFALPEFMLNFPDPVLVLIFFGSLCLFILSILCLYYFIKQCIRWAKQLLNWTSTKLKGE